MLHSCAGVISADVQSFPESLEAIKDFNFLNTFYSAAVISSLAAYLRPRSSVTGESQTPFN